MRLSDPPCPVGDYSPYLKRLAEAAEAGFSRRAQGNLRLLALWRGRLHPRRWHRLRDASAALTQCRHRARDAFELAKRYE